MKIIVFRFKILKENFISLLLLILLLILFKLIFIGFLLLYNALLVSSVRRSESPTCVHAYVPSLLGFLPSGHHSALRRVPCAMQYVLVSHLFYT